MPKEDGQHIVAHNSVEVGVQFDSPKVGASRSIRLIGALLWSAVLLVVLTFHSTMRDSTSTEVHSSLNGIQRGEWADVDKTPVFDESYGMFDEPNEKEYLLVLNALRKHEEELYAFDPQMCTPSNTDEDSIRKSSSNCLSNFSNLPWVTQLSSNILWEMSLQVPNKTARSAYFEALHQGRNPNWLPRYVHATVFRAAASVPQVVEYLVGPVDCVSPVATVYRKLPFNKRPMGDAEYGALVDYLAIICRRLNRVLKLAYDASYFKAEPSALWTNAVENPDIHESTMVSACHDPVSTKHPRGMPSCLIPSFASPIITYSDTQSRRTWFRLVRQVAPFIQYPVDIQFEIDHTPLNPTDWNLVSIWFQGHIYPSIEALIGAYENGSIHIIQRPFVDLYHTQLQPGPSQQQNLRFGNDVPTSEAISPRSLGDTLRSTFGPKQSSPSSSNLNRNGFKGVQMTKKHVRNRRISLRQRRVQFEHWDFHFTLRRETGLRVYNVRFAGRKLIAEAGLDETVTAYWGVSPFMRSMTSLESMYGVGAMTSSLSPGIDCPLEAIYLPALMIPNAQQGPRVIKQAICLFEWTMQPPGGPERRHFEFFGENIQAVDGSTPTASHTNFGLGVPSKALVLRSIASLFNYDYIFDIVFHNSGVVELAVTPTGYVHLDPVFSQRSENNTGGVQRPHSWDTNHAYGFPSSKFPIYFVIHQHLFLYQIDLDVMREKNFVRVVDTHGQINHNRGRSVCQFPGHSDESSCPALWMTFRDAKTEREARYSTSFEHPKQYLICQSGSEASDRVNPRCVSLMNRGAIKTLLGDNHTKSFSWSKYQLVVTKRKASEPYASSMFNGVDIVSPVVDFNSFSEDDENILHEDIVLWVTLGNIHLPRQEDLPNTGTSAGRLSLYIQPHNMFEYSPDAFSCDRVYTNSMAEWLKGFVESTDCVTEPIPML